MFDPKISPLHDGDLMFVASDEGGLYRTTNRGYDWTLIDGRDAAGFGPASDPSDNLVTLGFSVAFHPSERKIMAFRNWTELRVSTDDGETWELPPKQPPLVENDTSVYCAMGSGEEVAVASSDWNVYFSPDGGSTWVTTPSPGGLWIVGLAFGPGSGGASTLYVTTDMDISSYDEATNIWNPTGLQAFVASVKDSAGMPVLGTLKRITGFAVAADNLLYATIEATNQYAVLKYTGTWALAMGSGTPVVKLWDSGALPSNDLTMNPVPVPYGLVAVGSSDGQTVYVMQGWPDKAGGMAPDVSVPAVWLSTNGGGTWKGIYNGIEGTIPAPNVDGGLADISLGGWGNGYMARGFAVDPTNGFHALFTNNAAVHSLDSNKADLLAASGSTPMPPQWQQRYTSQDGPGPTGSIGLEVTTVWDYFIDSSRNHYIAYTDVGLCVSQDEGETWSVTKFTPPAGFPITRWSNCYQVIEVSGTKYAAVGQLHDLPLLFAPDSSDGALLHSSDGIRWEVAFYPDSSHGGPAPVVSVVYGKLSGESQYAWFIALYGGGVWASTTDPADPAATWTYVTGLKSSDYVAPSTPPATLAWGDVPPCYRLVIDDQGTLYCLVSLTGGGGAVFKATRISPPSGSAVAFQPLPALPITGTKATVPLDITVHTSGGTAYLFLATTSQGGAVGAVFLYDGTAWVRIDPELGDATPNWFGAYAIGDYLYLTSLGYGTYRALLADVEGSSSPRELYWEYVPLPFLYAQRLYFRETLGGIIRPFGGGTITYSPTLTVYASTRGYGVIVFTPPPPGPVPLAAY